MVYDFDGVLTDNKVLVFEDGKEAVVCNRSDGLAIRKMRENKIQQIFLSAEKSGIVAVRAKKLKIKAIHNVRDKKTTLIAYCKEKKYDLKKVLYVGNDSNDREAMKIVGYPVAPRDAHKSIKEVAKFIINVDGGQGVIRALYDRIILK